MRNQKPVPMIPVVRVVIGFGLQLAGGPAVSVEVAEALGGRIVGFDVCHDIIPAFYIYIPHTI